MGGTAGSEPRASAGTSCQRTRLSELCSMLPVIFLSGYLDIPVTVQAIKGGAHDFLTKPVASDELFAQLKMLSPTTKHYAI